MGTNKVLSSVYYSPIRFYHSGQQYSLDLDLYIRSLKGEKIALEICIAYYTCNPVDQSRPAKDPFTGVWGWEKPRIDFHRGLIAQYKRRIHEIDIQLEIIDKARR